MHFLLSDPDNRRGLKTPEVLSKYGTTIDRIDAALALSSSSTEPPTPTQRAALIEFTSAIAPLIQTAEVLINLQRIEANKPAEVPLSRQPTETMLRLPNIIALEQNALFPPNSILAVQQLFHLVGEQFVTSIEFVVPDSVIAENILPGLTQEEFLTKNWPACEQVIDEIALETISLEAGRQRAIGDILDNRMNRLIVAWGAGSSLLKQRALLLQERLAVIKRDVNQTWECLTDGLQNTSIIEALNGYQTKQATDEQHACFEVYRKLETNKKFAETDQAKAELIDEFCTALGNAELGPNLLDFYDALMKAQHDMYKTSLVQWKEEQQSLEFINGLVPATLSGVSEDQRELFDSLQPVTERQIKHIDRINAIVNDPKLTIFGNLTEYMHAVLTFSNELNIAKDQLTATRKAMNASYNSVSQAELLRQNNRELKLWKNYVLAQILSQLPSDAEVRENKVNEVIQAIMVILEKDQAIIEEKASAVIQRFSEVAA